MIARFLQTEDVRKTLLWAFCILLTALLVFGQVAFFASVASAHGDTYCGHSTRWDWPYKQVFRYHYANGDHHWTSTQWFYNGTGYHKVDGSTHHHRTDCH